MQLTIERNCGGRPRLFASSSRPLVVVFTPYAANGGGQAVQIAFCDVLKHALPEADVQLEELSGTTAGWRGRASLRPETKDLVSRAALLIFQGIYAPAYVRLTRYARTVGTSFLIVPRGDFVPAWMDFGSVHNVLAKKILWLLCGRRRLARAVAVVTTSELEQQRLQRVGGRACKWEIIPDPVVHERIGTGLPLPSATERPTALYLGRISSEKNLIFLVRLWPKVLASSPQATLDLVGSTTHPAICAEIERTIDQLHLQAAVRLYPWANEGEKARRISSARCVVLPSKFESFGLTVLDAMTYRTPVLTSVGTPWAHLPPAAGANLPLTADAWIIELRRWLSPPAKVFVPAEIAESVIEPSRPENVARRWRSLFQQLG